MFLKLNFKNDIIIASVCISFHTCASSLQRDGVGLAPLAGVRC